MYCAAVPLRMSEAHGNIAVRVASDAGMRAMDSRVVKDLAKEGDRRRSLTPLFLARAQTAVEVPIRHDPAKGGSHYSFLTLIAVACDFLLETARRPFVTTGVVAACAAAGAVALLLAGLVRRSAPVVLAAVVVLVGAVLALLISALGVYVQRIYELQQGRTLYRARDEDLSPPQ